MQRSMKLLLLAVGVVGLVMLIGVLSFAADIQKDGLIIREAVAPTPTPHPSLPANSYRSAFALPAAQDTVDGQIGSSPNPEVLPASVSTGYDWITPSNFPVQQPASNHQIPLPQCQGTNRFFIATPAVISDFRTGSQPQLDAIVRVATYQDSGVTYYVYATRTRWLCSVVGGRNVIVRP